MREEDILRILYQNFFPFNGIDDLKEKLKEVKITLTKKKNVVRIKVEKQIPYNLMLFFIKNDELSILIRTSFSGFDVLISKNGIFYIHTPGFQNIDKYFTKFKNGHRLFKNEQITISSNQIRSYITSKEKEFEKLIFVREDDLTDKCFPFFLREKENKDDYLAFLKCFFQQNSIKKAHKNGFIKCILEPYIEVNDEIVEEFKKELEIEWDVTLDEAKFIYEPNVDDEIPF